VKQYYVESRIKGISYIKKEEGRLIGFVTSCVGTVLLNILLKERGKEVSKGREENEEDVSSYWMN
jgi:hypothetical protein